mgnify:FL=1
MSNNTLTQVRNLEPSSTIKTLTIDAMFIALTLVFTAFINIQLPATVGGLIHLGNIPLFIAAMLFGKKTGAIAGGVGMALFDLNIPVTKTSSALLAMTKDEVAAHEPSACIRCGRCVAACPSNLIPQKMLEYAERFDDEGFISLNGMECYECGSCTYVCPAKRRLTQAFKQTRRSILDNRKKK